MLDDSDREQVGRDNSDAGANWSATTSAGGPRTPVAHSCRSGWCRWRDDLGRFGDGELFADGSCSGGGRHFVVIAATTEVDDIGVVRILKNAVEVALA